MNSQYVKGRAWEYARMKDWNKRSICTMRTAGSHGKYDLISVGLDGHIHLIQCKVVSTLGKANAMLEKWKESPPIGDNIRNKFYQHLEIKVHGSNVVHTCVV